MKGLTYTLYCITICSVIPILSVLLFIQSLSILNILFISILSRNDCYVVHIHYEYRVTDALHAVVCIALLYSCHAVVDCLHLSNPANGIVLFSSTNYNATASYSCNVGYTLTGDNVRICQSSAYWSGSEPTCNGKQ